MSSTIGRDVTQSTDANGNAVSTTSGIDISQLNGIMGQIVSGKETRIDEMLNGGNANLDDSASILELQQLMNEWSFTVGMQSAMVKTVADACKSMVQKIN